MTESFFKAAEEGSTSFLEKLTDEEFKKLLTLKNEDSRTVLHVAVSAGQIQVWQCFSLLAWKENPKSHTLSLLLLL